MQDTGVSLVGAAGDSEPTDLCKCIICQSLNEHTTTSTENGRKRIREAAAARNDHVAKRLRTIGDEEFVYHMDNQCYKAYTHKKTLENIGKASAPDTSSGNEKVRGEASTSRRSRSSFPPRPGPCHVPDMRELSCVICGHKRHQQVYQKYRISEFDRANKFLEATISFQDDVYTRTCDLQSVSAVFGADLYCHNLCIKRYLRNYERISEKGHTEEHIAPKQQAWGQVVKDIEIGINQGFGYELSFVRDCVNSAITSCTRVTNKEVNVLVLNHFGDRIRFSRPKEANKSVMFFGKNVSVQHMAEAIRTNDPIRQCAERIRQCLLEYDFNLQDRFCDMNDLKTAWESTQIPEPLLSFLSILYNFDGGSFDSSCGVGLGDDAEETSEGDDSGVSPSRRRQMLSLFQIMFYNLHNGRRRTPLHMLNSQAVYESSKSATLLTSLNRLGLCASYHEVMRNHTDIASFIVESCEDEVPFPSDFVPSQFTMAAFDNFDHEEATLSGIGGSHDTVTVLFQEVDDGGFQPAKPKVSETTVVHGAKAFNVDLKCQELRKFYKPAKKPDLPANYQVTNDPIPVDDKLLNGVRAKDVAWLLARLDLDVDPLYTVKIRPKNQTMPSWSGTNSVCSPDEINQKRIAFLPILPYPVTKYDTVYTAMKNLQSVLRNLDQSVLPVACDEGVYHIAREIQLIRPDEFSSIILCLGSFHMAKVVLGCLGKYLKGSGAENILVESCVFGINVVESVLDAKNYSRSLKGLQLLKEALCRLEWKEFFEQDENATKYREHLKDVVAFKAAVVSKSFDESVHLLEGSKASTQQLLSAFDDFRSKAKKCSETFVYWDTFITLATHLENLIRSDREGNWELHLQTVQALLPIFMAFDSTNYIRWGSLYLEDMRKLSQTAPEIHKAFQEGKFVIKRTPGNFRATGADMALEQTINRSKKSTSGIIGSTKKKKYVAMWDIIHHEMMAISNFYRELSGIRSYYQQDVNNSFSKSETEFGERNIQAILTVIENKENPFRKDAREPKLHNIMTQEVMTDEIRNQVLQVNEIGTAAYEKLRKERFVEQSAQIFQTIHRTNLKTFKSIRTLPKGQGSTGKSQTQKEDKHWQCVIEIARARGRSMKELLQYDLTSSSYLFDKQGLMAKASKSDLMNEMEKILTKDDAKVPDDSTDMQVGYIVDVMANTRKINAKECTNFGDFSGAIVDYIEKSAKNADRIDYIFDSYFDISIKDSERKRRETTTAIELNAISKDTPLPVQMERFWPASKNKHNLEVLLHQGVIKRAQDTPSSLKVFVSGFASEPDDVPCLSCCDGFCRDIPELCLDIEEADTRIIPHALHAVEQGIQRLVVLSPDTDVFVLLLYYWDVLHQKGLCELWMKAGSGNSTRHIPVHSLAARTGPDLCKVLPAVHTLTGCDYTSKVGTKQAALKATPVDYLQGFGCSRDGPCEDEIERTESYLVQVMKKGTTCTTMDELRDHNYHHSKGASLHQLPPTSHAIKAHIQRAYNAAYLMKSILSPDNTELNPLLFGYDDKDELLLPDMAVRPIPEEYAVQCTCLKCATERCACRKSDPSQPCCQFCRCQVMGDENVCCKNPAGCI